MEVSVSNVTSKDYIIFNHKQYEQELELAEKNLLQNNFFDNKISNNVFKISIALNILSVILIFMLIFVLDLFQINKYDETGYHMYIGLTSFTVELNNTSTKRSSFSCINDFSTCDNNCNKIDLIDIINIKKIQCQQLNKFNIGGIIVRLN